MTDHISHRKAAYRTREGLGQGSTRDSSQWLSGLCCRKPSLSFTLSFIHSLCKYLLSALIEGPCSGHWRIQQKTKQMEFLVLLEITFFLVEEDRKYTREIRQLLEGSLCIERTKQGSSPGMQASRGVIVTLNRMIREGSTPKGISK